MHEKHWLIWSGVIDPGCVAKLIQGAGGGSKGGGGAPTIASV